MKLNIEEFSHYPDKIDDQHLNSLLSKFNREVIESFDGSKIFTYEIGDSSSDIILFALPLGNLLFSNYKIILELSEKYRVITWESRGTPENPEHIGYGGLSMESHAKDMLAVARSKKIEKAHIVSFCSGSCTTLWALSSLEFEICSLCFLCIPIMTEKLEDRSSLQRNLLTLHDDIVNEESHAIDWLETELIDLLGGSENKVHIHVATKNFDKRKATYIFSKTISTMLKSNQDTVALIGVVTPPTLLIQTFDDESVFYNNALYAFSKLKNAKLLLYKTGGHTLSMVNSSRYVEDIIHFHGHLGLKS